MTVLEDIQNNTSEFNLSFHFQEVIGIALFNVFSDEQNREAIEEAMKLKSSPYELRPVTIGMMFSDFVKDYLKEPMDSEE